MSIATPKFTRSDPKLAARDTADNNHDDDTERLRYHQVAQHTSNRAHTHPLRRRPNVYFPPCHSSNLRLNNTEADTGALALLTSYFAIASSSGTFSIPPPEILSLLITMLVHPSTVRSPGRRHAAQFLSRVLDVCPPRAAKFEVVFTMNSRRRKRRIEETESDSDREYCVLEQDTLMRQADSIWDVVEWGFYRSEAGRGWSDLLALIVRILGNDFEGINKGLHLLVVFRGADGR